MNLSAFFRLMSDAMLGYLRVRTPNAPVPAPVPAAAAPSLASRSRDSAGLTIAQLKYVTY